MIKFGEKEFKQHPNISGVKFIKLAFIIIALSVPEILPRVSLILIS